MYQNPHDWEKQCDLDLWKTVYRGKEGRLLFLSSNKGKETEVFRIWLNPLISAQIIIFFKNSSLFLGIKLKMYPIKQDSLIKLYY